MAIYGATGLLIPAALSTVLAISEGGIIREEGGHVVLNWASFFASSYTWSVIVLALVSVLYISAMFLTYYAKKRETAWPSKCCEDMRSCGAHPRLPLLCWLFSDQSA